MEGSVPSRETGRLKYHKSIFSINNWDGIRIIEIDKNEKRNTSITNYNVQYIQKRVTKRVKQPINPGTTLKMTSDIHFTFHAVNLSFTGHSRSYSIEEVGSNQKSRRTVEL